MKEDSLVNLFQNNLDDVKIRVSSILNRDRKMFNPKNMLDEDETTCWNSDQGLGQFIHIHFSKEVELHEIQIMFQGGFVGESMEIRYQNELNVSPNFILHSTVYPKDSNILQHFRLKQAIHLTHVKLIFPQSTDFYGRITIYQLKALGKKKD